MSKTILVLIIAYYAYVLAQAKKPVDERFGDPLGKVIIAVAIVGGCIYAGVIVLQILTGGACFQHGDVDGYY